MTDQFDVMLRLEALAREGRSRGGLGAARPAGRGSLEDARATIEQLEVALEHRTVISQAVGITMERFSLTRDGAFEVLSRLSGQTGTKLYDLAGGIVEAAEAAGRHDEA